MTVAVYVTNKIDASTLIPWGVRFAHADHTDLLLIVTKRSKGKTDWADVVVTDRSENPIHVAIHQTLASQDTDNVVLKQDIAAGVESSDMDRVAVAVREFSAPIPERAIIVELNSLKISLLLIPAHEPTKTSHDETPWARQLFDHSPCESCLIRGPAPDASQPIRILLATHGTTNIETELTRSRQLAHTYKGTVTVLYVRPNDDIVADRVAYKNLERMIRQVSGPYDAFEKQISLQNSVLEGIKQQDLEDFDLVLIGSRNRKTVRQVFRSLSDNPETPSKTAVATMRQGVPLASRLWSRFTTAFRRKIPQLDRGQRVELVDRLQSTSTFDFDFVALIALSTLIAGLGLIRNSSAVVIGAMLIAPLMTPLIGIGFALIQGNEKLIRNALRTVVLGFAVAFAIGAFLGLVIPNEYFLVGGRLNFELISRCEPNWLDLIVALASGMAGAYATGRPNLISALPGVAIAAALVPPIATSGVLFAAGEFGLSGGALLLFFTNIVAIVLGTTFAFWGIGISTQTKSNDGRKPDIWPRYWFFAFVIISFLLAIYLPTRNGPVEKHKSEQKPVSSQNENPN